jgi:protein-L-isoaspartate(D-aspartate) O-methyltransferase
VSGEEARLNAGLIERISRNMRGAGDSLPEHIAAAFRAVPRHLFVPDLPLDQAYEDQAIVLKDERGEPRSSSSQPTVMAVMLSQLDLQEGHSVLEIGTGSGYNAALMAQIVGERGRVVTIDLDEEIAASAREQLAAAGARSVEVVVGDGADGSPIGAPYDRIVVTAAAWDVPLAWRAQLVDDGRIVMPLIVHGTQACVAFRPAGDHLETTSIRQCGFMPLRGVSGRRGKPLALGARDGLFVEFPAQDEPPVTAEAVYAWLNGPWTEEPTPVTIDSPADVFQAEAWLALRDPAYCRLTAYGDDAEHDLLPSLPQPLMSHRSSRASGSADSSGLAVVTLPDPRFGGEPSRLFVRRYGDAEAAARRLVEQLQAWDAAGRPPALPRRIRVYPRTATLPPGADVLVRRESVLVVE